MKLTINNKMRVWLETKHAQTAVEEAGRAFMFQALGWEDAGLIEFMRLFPLDEILADGGQNYMRYPWWSKCRVEIPRDAKHNDVAVFHMAPTVAELTWTRDEYRRSELEMLLTLVTEGDSEELEAWEQSQLVLAVEALIKGGNGEFSKVIAQAVLESTRDLLEANWPIVDELRGILVSDGVVTGEQISEVCRGRVCDRPQEQGARA